jgi:hypothetical protein
MIDAVAAATNLAPVGSQVVSGDDVVPNPLFAGLDYPDKLESYFHVGKGPHGAQSVILCYSRRLASFCSGVESAIACGYWCAVSAAGRVCIGAGSRRDDGAVRKLHVRASCCTAGPC